MSSPVQAKLKLYKIISVMILCVLCASVYSQDRVPVWITPSIEPPRAMPPVWILPNIDLENPVLPATSNENAQATPNSSMGQNPVENLEELGIPARIRVQSEGPFADRIEYNSCVPEADDQHSYLVEHFFEALTRPVKPLASMTSWLTRSEHDEIETHLRNHPIDRQPIPSRPGLLIETNERFLEKGVLSQGIVTPTGAIWRPAFWVFGTHRSGFNYFDNQAGQPIGEWANRLDLFGQLNLTGTERLLIGLRPFDEEQGAGRQYTGVNFRNGQSVNGANIELQTLFFEGDFGEIFPRLDPYDTRLLDYGFSVGRQPMSFQQGLLINEDMIDAVTVTRNTLSGMGNLNLRITGVYAWDKINRNNNTPDSQAQLYGIFTESDFANTTMNADIAWLSTDSVQGGVVAWGLSGIQRFHGYKNTYNSSLHLLGSTPTDGETAASGNGLLLFSQLSWTAHHSEDLVYLNGFWAIDQFTSPSRGPLGGGPLGQTGILFAAAGLGQLGAPLSSQASDAVGGSIGYQLFFDETRQQVIFELGGRTGTQGNEDGSMGVVTRFQRALNKHWVIVIDGFATKTEGRNVAPGTRIEFLAKF